MGEPRTLGEFEKWLERESEYWTTRPEELGVEAEATANTYGAALVMFQRLKQNAPYRIEKGARSRSTNGRWSPDPTYRAAIADELQTSV